MTHRVPQAELSPEVLRTFPRLATASDEVLENLHQAGMQVEVPAQRLMYVPGEPCMGFPLVLSGRARVYTVGENGREITLYRLCAGETCVLAVACILSRRMLPAYIVAETSGAVLLVPPETFRGWFEQVPFWRTFVFSLLAERLANVIAITNDALFGRLDARVAAYLLEAPARMGTTLRLTHQDIAAELGSSREVVSRILKRFEHERWLRLGRGSIDLQDRDALASRAAGDDAFAKASGG